MANRLIGEISTKFEGQKYTLRLDYNAIAEFEDMSGKKAFDVFKDFEAGSPAFRDLRLLIQAALLRHHPDATLILAGDIVSNDGDLVTKLLQAAFPSPEAETAGKG